jgi:hypothetical protein
MSKITRAITKAIRVAISPGYSSFGSRQPSGRLPFNPRQTRVSITGRGAWPITIHTQQVTHCRHGPRTPRMARADKRHLLGFRLQLFHAIRTSPETRRTRCPRRPTHPYPVSAAVGGSSPPRATKVSVTRTGVAGRRKVGMMLSRLSTLTSTISSVSNALR